jgi:hypothetical protein
MKSRWLSDLPFVCALMLAMVSGNYSHAQLKQQLKDRECQYGQNCSKMQLMNHPNCPPTHPDCRSTQINNFWACYPKNGSNCITDTTIWGSTNCFGSCSLWDPVQQQWHTSLLFQCGYTIDNCN